MPSNNAMSVLLERIGGNAVQYQQSYPTSEHLLAAAVGEAFPWVLGLPVVRARIPSAMRGFIPGGSPVTLDKLERLATQLVAILAASYAPQDNGAGAYEESPAEAARQQASIHILHKR